MSLCLMEPEVLWSSYWRPLWLEEMPLRDGMLYEVMMVPVPLLDCLAVEVCKEFARLAIDLCNQKVFC